MITAQAARGLLLHLLLGHAALDQLKVAHALFKRTVVQLDAAAGRQIGQMGRRDFNIRLDDMMEPEMRVDVRSCNLAGCYRADYRRRCQ